MSFIDLKYYLKRLLNDYKFTLHDLFGKYEKVPNKISELSFVHFTEKLYFDVTNICNARCTFCIYRKIFNEKNRKSGVMAFEIFKKAVDEYSKLGGKSISLTPTVGEPLLDPALLYKIDYAVNQVKIKKVYFYTNGILLSKDKLYKNLIDSGIHEINISTQGCDKNLFEQVYGVSASVYDELIRGLSNLLQYNKEKRESVAIRIQFRSAQKPSEVLKSPDFLKYIKPFLSERVSYSFLVDYDNWGGSISQADLIGHMKMRRRLRARKAPCLGTFRASILFDGSVRLCGCRIKDTEFDELVVGHINDDSLEKTYLGERANKIRKSFLQGNPPEICKDCTLYDTGNLNYFR